MSGYLLEHITNIIMIIFLIIVSIIVYICHHNHFHLFVRTETVMVFH